MGGKHGSSDSGEARPQSSKWNRGVTDDGFIVSPPDGNGWIGPYSGENSIARPLGFHCFRPLGMVVPCPLIKY